MTIAYTDIDMKMPTNYLAAAIAGRTPEFIQMKQVGVSHKSGSARLADR